MHELAERFDVAVVGGGFAGTAVVLQLARLAGTLRIVMFDRAGAFGRGAAYANVADRCILNVRAKQMGAFPDDEGHFLTWLRARQRGSEWGHADALGETFAPRRLYGEYLAELLATATAGGTLIERCCDEVVSVTAGGCGYLARTAKNRFVVAPAIVLAIGNLPPLASGVVGAALRQHARNPWDYLAGAELDPQADVVIVGTGLTALDVLIKLQANAHAGTITTLSRNGRFPLAHALADPDKPGTLAPLSGSPRHVLRALRRYVADGVTSGRRWQDLVDDVRPQANRIWQGWTRPQQEQFDRHLASLWSVHRHRAPGASLEIPKSLLLRGQLRVVAGRLSSIEVRTDERLQVRFVKRGASVHTCVNADVLIDCSGPPRDLARSDDPFVTALLATGFVHTSGAGGFVAASDGRVDQRRNPGGGIFALGTPLRGSLLETGAVREIRAQARTVAEAIVVALARGDDETSQAHPSRLT